MMRFNVNGQYLELPSDFSLQFKKSNVLFAFDNMECERSTTFEIPATPQNDRIFSLSRQVQNVGAGMRTRYDAELQGSGVTKRGYLYVSSADKSAYNAVFVTGELLGLQAIRNAGKLADILSGVRDFIEFNSGIYDVTPKSTGYRWANIRHKSTDGKTYPSWRLDRIVNDALAEIGVAWVRPTMYVRAVVGEPKLMPSMPFTVSRGLSGMWADVTHVYPYNQVTTIGADAGIEEILSKADFGAQYRMHYRDYDQSNKNITYGGGVQHFVAQQRIAISFASDFPSDVYIGTFNGAGGYTGTFTFYGERSFGKSWDGTHSVTTRTGDPLAGRSVTIERGQSFCFIRESDLLDYTAYTGDLTSDMQWAEGWQNVRTEATFDKMTIEGTGDIADGFRLRFVDNLPDLSIVDLLKVIAALTGKVLYYTDDNGVIFDDLQVSTWSVFDLSGKVLSVGDVTREFGNYAQKNIVEFDSGDGVLGAEQLRVTYDIINTNLEKEKVLQTIPFSEGGSDGVYMYFRAGVDVQTLADADSEKTNNNMLRVGLQKIAAIQTLCDASTAVTIKARLSLVEFESVTPKTLLYYDGVRYVWTEAQWSKDVATFKLSKT